VTDFQLARLVFHEVEVSEGFAGWLGEQRVSLAFTNANRLFLVGLRSDGSLSVVEQGFGTCTALAVAGPSTLFLATRYQIWRLENALPPGQVSDEGHDALFIPQTAWTTGLLGVHGLSVGPDGRLVFVNGRFSCLATVSETLNFEPVWRPPFISALVPEDRCRLTGVAVVDGRPAYVTSASQADTADGWRQHRRDGGVVLRLPEGEVLARGLSMPSSPVVSGGRLWLANGGAGEVGLVDVNTGRFDPVTALPGFTRGLAIHGRFAAVGLSRPPWGETIEGLPMEDRLARSGEAARCGISVLDLESAQVAHSLVLDGVGPDVGDVALLPELRSPTAVGFQGDDVQEWVTTPRL
jgi:uncharacterized protein (TIGR03032 family)